MKTFLTTIVFCLLLAVSSSRAADYLKGFPQAGEGMVRFVLPLPMQDDESVFNLELIVGKTVRIDAQNNYFFDGKIEEEAVLGWGFNYYRVASLGPMTGTFMAVDADTPKVDRFVTLGGSPYFIRYNSRLPVVIYVPEGVEVRYRLWSAGPEIRLVDEG